MSPVDRAGLVQQLVADGRDHPARAVLSQLPNMGIQAVAVVELV
jgi:hypothetical protein